MKKILLILIIVLITSCKSSINYLKDGEFKELKMPYSVKDYPDSSEEFYSIVNASGTNLNINRNRALLEAKTYLSGRIKTIINSVANQKLSFSNDIESEEFDQKATSISNQSIQKIIKVDSKVYKQKSGDKYDLWVVYKERIPISYQLVYSRETHKALEGVKEKSEGEGKFMVLREEQSEGAGTEDGAEKKEGGITIGGDISFYEWEYKSDSQHKNPEGE